MGLMPLGMAMAGPIADQLGLQATLLGMSAVGLAGALGWLAQPSVRRLRRPPAATPEAAGGSRRAVSSSEVCAFGCNRECFATVSGDASRGGPD